MVCSGLGTSKNYPFTGMFIGMFFYGDLLPRKRILLLSMLLLDDYDEADAYLARSNASGIFSTTSTGETFFGCVETCACFVLTAT